MLAQAASHRLHDVAVVRHQLGESPGQLSLIELAQALDHCLFRREGAVEIAGAHADFVGDVLHCRRMEAMADKGALGRFQDSQAPFGVSGPPSGGGRGHRHEEAHENECSFSWNAANVASE